MCISSLKLTGESSIKKSQDQCRIQDFPDGEGVPTPQFEAQTYYLGRFLPKTA